MGLKIEGHSDEAEKAVRDIRRPTRRHFSAEDKIRIMIAGLRSEDRGESPSFHLGDRGRETYVGKALLSHFGLLLRLLSTTAR